MRIFLATALVVGIILGYGPDPHATTALDYNGVRALVAQMLASLKS